MPDEKRHALARSKSPDVALSPVLAATIFALFVVVALSAGLVFNTISVALPKIVDERVGNGITLIEVGGLTSAVFLCGAIAQITVGRLVERIQPHILFASLAVMQFGGVVWSAFANGTTLLFALAFTMAAIYGQITVNDLIIARYTADAWRSRIYAVRYFLTFMISGVAVSMIALLYGRGGFGLVLGATAIIAMGFLIAAILIAILANGVERARVPQPAPAEYGLRRDGLIRDGLWRVARRDRHADHRRAAEQHVDADEQAERPGRRARQAGEDDAGEDQVDDAARQHPAPAAGELRAVIDGVHHRGDALGDEERDQHQGQRHRAADRPADEQDAGDDGDDRRQQRPPEAGRVAHPERRHQADAAADQEQPADDQREGQRRHHRQDDRGDAQDDEDETLDQKQHPMVVDRAFDGTLHVVEPQRRGHGHNGLLLKSRRDGRPAAQPG